MECGPHDPSAREAGAPKPEKARPFQLRLSTCVLTMLMAGCLFLLNTIPISYDDYTARGLPLHYETTLSHHTIGPAWACAINIYVGFVFLFLTAKSIEWMHEQHRNKRLAQELAWGFLMLLVQAVLQILPIWLFLS